MKRNVKTYNWRNVPNELKMIDSATSMNVWVPSVEEESCNGIHLINLQTRHFANRRIFLTGEVTEDMANNFVSELLYLAQTSEQIDIFINSPGGSVNAGLVIYDVIQSCEGRVPLNMYCIGEAASMAAVILAGGQKGCRYILPHSKVMIHEPLIPGGMGGSATSIRKMADSILDTKTIMNAILAKHTGKSIEEIDKATSYDNYMNAETAIDFGICDQIRNLF